MGFASSITNAVAVPGKGFLRLASNQISRINLMTLVVATSVVTDAGILHFAFHSS